MSYIGKTPTVGNFQICDAISTVNNQAAYTMQVGSVNVIPETAQNMIVSLNGVIQKPNSSYTVAGAVITFSSALVTGDVINFIQILGSVLDLGVPSDNTVSTAKIVNGAVTSAKLASGVGGVAGITSSANATAMTITSAEKIGIGETSPLGLVHIKTADSGASASGDGDELILENGTSSGTSGLSILSATNGYGSINFGDSGDNNIGIIDYEHSNNLMRFSAGANKVFELTASTVVVNEDSNDVDFRVESNGQSHMLFVDAGNDRIGILDNAPGHTLESGNSDSGKGWSLANENNVYKIRARASANDTQTHIQFENGNGICGTIKTNVTSTAYATSSDYRLKENVSYNFDATTRLKQLKPARFNFKADADTTVDGFIAHEVTSIVPEAVTGTKDATKTLNNVILNADGSFFKQNISQADWIMHKTKETFANDTTWVATYTMPEYQGIDQSKIVPLLVKTIQELEARITTLENA